MRTLSAFVLVFLLTGTPPVLGVQNVLKDRDGKTLAVILDCSSCGKRGDRCEGGVENGFHDGSRCGRCLLEANYGRRPAIPYDVRILGRLKDEKGEPMMGKFVRLSLPNKWSIRTRTREGGVFVFRMGPTVERKGKEPLVLDLGERKTRRDSNSTTYFFFMLPEDYKPCGSEKNL